MIQKLHKKIILSKSKLNKEIFIKVHHLWEKTKVKTSYFSVL